MKHGKSSQIPVRPPSVETTIYVLPQIVWMLFIASIAQILVSEGVSLTRIFVRHLYAFFHLNLSFIGKLALHDIVKISRANTLQMTSCTAIVYHQPLHVLKSTLILTSFIQF